MSTEPSLSAAAPTRPATSDLIATLRDKAPRVAMSLAAGQMAWPAVKMIRARITERSTYTVKVPGSDDIYDDLHEWVLSLLSPGDRRALVAWSSKRHALATPDGYAAEPAPLRLRYDGARQQAIKVDGHKVMVIVNDGVTGKDDSSYWKPPEIVFTVSSSAARDALLSAIRRVLAASHGRKREPSFRMVGKWGSEWDRLDGLPPRDLASVILPSGQMERLTDDVARFLAAESEYARRCIPWHRGHLYEGPPGTGKTSVARAIAGHFGMDIWYMPLADVKKDGELLRLASRIGPRSMLLLEDVDVFHAATQRDDESEVTLSGLLNTLDGIATPHGLLTVLTSNHPEVLDDAVIRAGRIDRREHFSLAGPEEISRLVARYYGECTAIGEPLTAAGIAEVAPAEVIEACKRYDTPVEALAGLARSQGKKTAKGRAA